MKLVSILLRFVLKMDWGKRKIYIYIREQSMFMVTHHIIHSVFTSPTTFSFQRPRLYSNNPLFRHRYSYKYSYTHTYTSSHTSLHSHLATYPSTMKFLSAYLALFPVTISALGNAVILNSSPHTIYAWSVGSAISARQIIVPGTPLPLLFYHPPS
jgi:hypothetical protein